MNTRGDLGDGQGVVRPLHILFVNWRCIRNPLAGGAEVHLHKLGSVLACKGHIVKVLCCGYRGGAAQEDIDGVTYVRTGREYSFFITFRTALDAILRQEDFELVVDDISKIPLGVSRYTALPVIAVCHQIHGCVLDKELPRPAAAVLKRLERRIGTLYRDTPVLAVSESTRKELITLGLREERVGVFHNGIDVDILAGDTGARSRRPPILVSLSRLRKYKNVECILRAFRRVRAAVPDSRLLVVGTGKHEEGLRDFSRRIGSDGVEFIGYAQETEKWRLLSEARILVAASIKEGWGISILEANAKGVPAVASDVPGFCDSVRHGETGFLYRYDDDKELAARVIELITDESRWQVMSDAARRWASKFTWTNCAQDFLDHAARYYSQLSKRS